MGKRAEEKAVKWYDSVKYKSDLSGTPISGYIAGYEQAEKDTMKWVQHYILTHDTIDIFEMEDEFNKENE